jgi:hypothetical protein
MQKPITRRRKITFQKFIKIYLEKCVRRGEDSRTKLERAIKRHLSGLFEKNVSEISATDIQSVIANINGVADPSMMPACVMKHAVGLAGVDSLICSTFSPEANSKITAYLNKAGYKQRKCGTYYDACEEGWAPTPTNAVQKKIWDKVHKLPTKPLMIVPESQRKKNN